jgi:hypothetical protein
MDSIKVVFCVNIYGIVRVNLNLINVAPIDVHTFDTKLINLEGLKKYDTATKQNKISELLNYLSSELKLNVTGISLIYNGIGTSANIDVINKYDADDLLVNFLECIEKLDFTNKNDALTMLVEQMEDMRITGPCPQGRTIRLIGLILPFYDLSK